MRELRVVLRREFVERVRSKSFILSTMLTPLFLLAVGLGPALFARVSEARELRIAVIDETGSGMGAQVAAMLRAGAGEGEDALHPTVIAAPLLQVRDSLIAAMALGQTDLFLHLPRDMVDAAELQVWTRNALPGAQRRRIAAALSTAVQTQRLEETGLSAAELARVLRPVQLNTIRLTAEGEREQSDVALIFAFMMAFFLYTLIMLYGTQVMQSVQEEKTNRIAEVLVSSIEAPKLMLGKVLGVGSAALLQVSIWIALGAAFVSQSTRLESFGLPPEVTGSLARSADAAALATGLAFMIGGFFLYATLFAAVGAAAETSEDAQRFTLPLVMPLILPLVMGERIISAPGDTAAILLSWFPLTTPIVLPMRMAVDGATGSEVSAALVYLVLSIVAAGWIAGKIYRVGILSTGKRVGWTDLVRWVRMA